MSQRPLRKKGETRMKITKCDACGSEFTEGDLMTKYQNYSGADRYELVGGVEATQDKTYGVGFVGLNEPGTRPLGQHINETGFAVYVKTSSDLCRSCIVSIIKGVEQFRETDQTSGQRIETYMDPHTVCALNNASDKALKERIATKEQDDALNAMEEEIDKH